MYNGYTPSLSRNVLIATKRATLEVFVAEQPENKYWSGMLEAFNEAHPVEQAFQMEQADKNTEAVELASDAQWLNSDLSTNSDGRNEIENAQITATFGKVKVTTSAEWRRRHLHQTAAEVEAARVQAEMLKGK